MEAFSDISVGRKLLYEGWYESNASGFFLSQFLITVTMKFTYIMGTSFTHLGLKFPSLSTHFFPPLCELLFAGYIELFVQGLWDLSPMPFSPLIK